MSNVVQTQEEWENEMSHKILQFVKEELYQDYRFFYLAFQSLFPKANQQIHTLATDGQYLFFSSEQFIRLIKNNPGYLNRLYLHTILHCIFSHLWTSGKKKKYEWSIACDIAVEYTIDSMQKKSTKRIIGLLRQNVYQEIRDKKMDGSAAQIYYWLMDKDIEMRQVLHQEFYADDHVFWPKEEEKNAQVAQTQKKWNKIARQMKMEQKRSGDEQEKGVNLLQKQLSVQKQKRSYRDFLKKFMVMQEEIKCDPEEFDLNYYTYGLQLYENMPLIEPVESCETLKIQELVIVIDTSYSTSGELVKQFLQETCNILYEKESFFQNNNLHIIQCDEKVQKDSVIRKSDDLDKLFSEFEIIGGGGTDFRPAFQYVNDLLEKKKFKNLRGLLYFTDGKGIYPKKKPPYKTAFLFMQTEPVENIPAWAIRLYLEREEFLNS